MPTPRAQLVSLADTPWYHVVSRCVRRAFLCGVDAYSGQDYEHRRPWVEKRVAAVARVFAIDVAAYAIMSNHYHLVLHVDVDRAAAWSMDDVIERWHALFNGTRLSQRYQHARSTLTDGEVAHVRTCAEVWRARLADISWFMRCVNEPIARQANAEDRCTGLFWEGRFKSQALLDDAAVLAAMAYADLNPIRANLAETPETSEHTSIKRRIEQAKSGNIPSGLMRFQGDAHRDKHEGIPFALAHYVELVDLTGRVVRGGKRGAMDDTLPPILERLGIDADTWLSISTTFETSFQNWVGTEAAIQRATRNVGKTRSRSPPLFAA
ncbi:MAG: transposase [Pseudomonadota bacterium]